MSQIRSTLTLSMLGVSAFGISLLGGLGSCSAGKAAAAAKVLAAPNSTAEERDEASAMRAASIASAVFFFAGLAAFGALLLVATYKR
jgi:hypothetical protein